MSVLCCCIPLTQQKQTHFAEKSFEGIVDLNALRKSRTIPTLPPEIWEKILGYLPLHVLWQNARPTCRKWNNVAINIVTTLSLTTIVDVTWHTSEKLVRQRLYPFLIQQECLDYKPFSRILRWNLPEFEKAIQTGQRDRYKPDHIVLITGDTKSWQNTAVLGIARKSERKDTWEFEPLAYQRRDLDESLFDLSWIPRWRVTFRESEIRRSTSSRADVHLDHVSVPLAHFVKLVGVLEEDWPSIEKIDGFDKKPRRSRPNSGILTPRRRSAPGD
jgi:F-box-like